MKNDRVPNIPRAGIVPYIWDDKKQDYIMLFMVPSLSKYGGPQIQIGKGGVDKGESVLQAATREGKEELGLKKSNFLEKPFELGKYSQGSGDSLYYMTVYAVEIKDKKDFNKPHFETKFTTWATGARFAEIGAKRHKAIIDELTKLLKSYRE